MNLATGKRTRLTGNPDYDEDNAVSRDGRAAGAVEQPHDAHDRLVQRPPAGA